MRYLRCHLGFPGFGILVLLVFLKMDWHFKPFGIFFLHLGILTILASLAFLASWHLGIKKDTIKDQSCLDFGIFTLSCYFLLNFTIPKCQRCQKCQNGQNAKMQKKMPKPENDWKPVLVPVSCVEARVLSVWWEWDNTAITVNNTPAITQ